MWVYGPFVSSPEAIYANDNWGGRRESWDGVDISTKYYEFGSPITSRSPEFMQRRRRHLTSMCKKRDNKKDTKRMAKTTKKVLVS